jgi:hypothetical protein
MFRSRFITSTEWLVEWRSIDGVIIAGKTEVNEKVPRRSPCPRICLCLVAKVPTSTQPGRVKRFGIHVRWVKHDVFHCTVPSIGHVRPEGKARIKVNQPMSDVIFVHEMYSLLDSGIRFDTSKLQRTHLAYLSKKGDELSKRLKRRFIKRAQKGLHKDGRVVWQLDDI